MRFIAVFLSLVVEASASAQQATVTIYTPSGGLMMAKQTATMGHGTGRQSLSGIDL
jgi:hypothetical protein